MEKVLEVSAQREGKTRVTKGAAESLQKGSLGFCTELSLSTGSEGAGRRSCADPPSFQWEERKSGMLS